MGFREGWLLRHYLDLVGIFTVGVFWAVGLAGSVEASTSLCVPLLDSGMALGETDCDGIGNGSLDDSHQIQGDGDSVYYGPVNITQAGTTLAVGSNTCNFTLNNGIDFTLLKAQPGDYIIFDSPSGVEKVLPITAVNGNSLTVSSYNSGQCNPKPEVGNYYTSMNFTSFPTYYGGATPGTFRLVRPKPMDVKVYGKTSGNYCNGGINFGLECTSNPAICSGVGVNCIVPNYQVLWHEVEYDGNGQYHLSKSEILPNTGGADFTRTVALKPGLNRLTRLQYIRNVSQGGRIDRIGDINQRASETVEIQVDSIWEFAPGAIYNGHFIKAAYSGGLRKPYFDDGDLDGDGRSDLVVLDKDHGLLWYRNEGWGPEGVAVFSKNTENLIVSASKVLDIIYYAVPTVGDVTGDGNPDIVVGYFNGSLSVYQNISHYNATDGRLEGPLLFELLASHSLSARSAGTYAAPELGDWDNDGDLDLFLCSGDSNLKLYPQIAPGVFSGTALAYTVAPDIILGGGAPTKNFCQVRTGDLNADGKLDFLVSHQYTNRSEIYLNIGSLASPSWLSQGIISGPTQTLKPASMAILPLRKDGPASCLGGTQNGSACQSDPQACAVAGGECLFYPDVVYLQKDGSNYAIFRGLSGGGWPQSQNACAGGTTPGVTCSGATCGIGGACIPNMADTYDGEVWRPYFVLDVGRRATLSAGNYQWTNPRKTCIGGAANGSDCTYDDAVCGAGVCMAISGGVRVCEGGALDGTDCTDDSIGCQANGGQCHARRNDLILRATAYTSVVTNHLLRGERKRCEGGADDGAVCWIDSHCSSLQCVDDGNRCSGGPNQGMRCDPASLIDCPGMFCRGGKNRGDICSTDPDCPDSVCRDATCMKNGVPAHDSRSYCQTGLNVMSDCETASDCGGGTCGADVIDWGIQTDEIYQLVDWNNDGDLDLMSPTVSGGIMVFHNCDVKFVGDAECTGLTNDPWLDGIYDAGGQISYGNAGTPGGTTGIFAFDAMDFDQDSKQDMMLLQNNNYVIYPNTGDDQYPFCFSNNADSIDCLPTSGFYHQGSLTYPNEIFLNPTALSGAMLDVDKDGLLDMVIAENVNKEFWVYLNSGTLAEPEYRDVMVSRDFLGLRWDTNLTQMAILRAGDLNGDGDRDVWYTDLDGGLVLYMSNDGAPTVAFNSLPILVNQQNGDVEVDLSLTEGDLGPVDLFVEYTDMTTGQSFTSRIGAIMNNPGGAIINNAAPEYRIENVSTAADPSQIRFYWNAGMDLGFNFNGSLRIRVTAMDAQGEIGSAISEVFFVDMSIPYSSISCSGDVYINSAPVTLDYVSKYTVDLPNAIWVDFYARNLPAAYALVSNEQTSFATNTNCATPANCSLYRGDFDFTPSLGEGIYELYSIARDPVALTAEAPPGDINNDGFPDANCTVVFDATPPVVSITSPVSGAVVSTTGLVTITGTVSDPNFFGTGPECLTVVGNVNLTVCEGETTAGGLPKITFNGSGASATYTILLEPADTATMLTLGADTFQVQAVDLAGNSSATGVGGNPTVAVTLNTVSDNLRLTFPQLMQMITSGQAGQPALGYTTGNSAITLSINGASFAASINVVTGLFTWSQPLSAAALADGCGNVAQAVSVNGGDTGLVTFCYSLAGSLAQVRVKVIQVGASVIPPGTFQDRASAIAGTIVTLQVEGVDNFGNAGSPIAGAITWSKIGDIFAASMPVSTTVYPNDTVTVALQTVPANFDLGATLLESVGLLRASVTDLDPITGTPLADYSGVLEALSNVGAAPASTTLLGTVRNLDQSFPTRYQFQMVGFRVPAGQLLDPFDMEPTWRVRSDLSPGNGYNPATGQFVFDLASFRQTWAAGDSLYMRFNNAESGHQAWYQCPLASVGIGATVSFSSICCPVRWAQVAGQLSYISSCAADMKGDAVLKPRPQELVRLTAENLNKMVVPNSFGSILRAFDLLKTVPTPSQISVYDNLTKQPYSMSIFSDENLVNSLVTPGRAVETRVMGGSVWP